MKITDKDFKTLSDIIHRSPRVDYEMIARLYESGNIPRAASVKDLQKRFCFDMLHASPGGLEFQCDTLYAYMNDDHIYTALKKLLPRVEKKF